MQSAVSSLRGPALISIDPEEREILALFDLANLDRKHVLEIGPGTGRLTWRYADRAARVTAVDPWVDGIERARQTTPAAVASRVEFHPTAFLDFAAARGPSVYDVAILSWSLCWMEPEGMVHALKNIHRLLRPDGVLIDIHPAREAPLVEVHADGRIVVTETYTRAHGDDVVQAEEALAEIVRRGVFAKEAVRAFEFMMYASSVAELRAFFEEAGAYDTSPIIDQVAARRDAMYARVEEVRRRIGKRAEIGFREPTRMSRLVPR